MTLRYKVPLPSAAMLAAILALCLPRQAAKAEDSIAYRYESYREEDGRVTVDTQSGSADEDIGAFAHIRLTGTIDAISGATPTGQPANPGSDQVVLSQIHDRRKAWSGDLSEQVRDVNIDVGFADSREEDYVSAGWSVNTLTDFNEKNTTLRVGLAGTDDRVEVFYEPAYLPKHSLSAIAGITQVLGPLTFATFNVSLARATGYLGEPYKLVVKSIEIFQNIYLQEAFAENRPNARNRDTLYGSLNHAFPGAHGAVEGSYRFYTDTYGIVAHAVELSWIQHLGANLLLEPSVRYYQQSAAHFYFYDLNGTSIIPVRIPTGAGTNYSSDFRLSALSDYSCGLTASWKPRDWMQLDLGYERYAMHGRDGVTPASAYPVAGITTLGAKFIW